MFEDVKWDNQKP